MVLGQERGKDMLKERLASKEKYITKHKLDQNFSLLCQAT
jgi:hypothetical protein